MKYIKALLLVFSLLFSFSSFCLSDEIRTKVNTYISQGDYFGAQKYIETELLNPHDNQTKLDLNQTLVSVLIFNSNYKEALEIAFATIDTMSPSDDRSSFYFLIGCIFYAVEDYGKSTEYLELSLASKDPSAQVKTLLMLSDIYLQTEKQDKVLETLEEANKIAAEFTLAPQTEDHIAQQYNFHSGKYDLCKEICHKIISDSTNFLNTRCNAFSVLGDCLVEQDSLAKSANHYVSALELTIETGDPDLIKTTSWKLIEVYEALGLQDKANGYHKIYNDAINDSAYFSIDKYRELYYLEQERHAKPSLPKSAKPKTIYFWQLIVGILIIVGLAFFFMLKKMRTKEKNSLIKTSKPAKKIQINSTELEKIKASVDRFISEETFLKSKITLKSFCEESSITSERYLSQFINEKYEKSFSNFVNDLRIEFAYNRISSDKQFRNYKIDVIAQECGFGSRKTFERVFLAKYDQSPFDFINSFNNL
jgi:AraC-like DNA-binding protein